MSGDEGRTSAEIATDLALDLLKLGVSSAAVQDLLAHYSYDLIERQLTYLPYRKAKRPEALIIEAIRHNYSAPKECFYAPPQTESPGTGRPMDQDPE